MTLDEFVVDARVYAAASVFPVHLEMHSTGRSPVRFMLLNHPDGTWWAAAWINTYTSATPELVLLARVVTAHGISAKSIVLDVASDDGSSVHTVRVTPSAGGCCGSRLKSWQPFGSAQMVYKPHSQVVV